MASTTDSATFAARDLPTLRRGFIQKLAPVIKQTCAMRLTAQEMAQCLDEAAKYSGWGRFMFANNYWMIPGRGDAGAFLLVRVHPDFSSVGGVRPLVDKYAKFTNLPVALDAWCRRRGK